MPGDRKKAQNAMYYFFHDARQHHVLQTTSACPYYSAIVPACPSHFVRHDKYTRLVCQTSTQVHFFRHYSAVSVHTDLIQAVAHKKRAAHDDWPPLEVCVIPAKRIARKRMVKGCLLSYLSCFRHSDTFFSIRCKISSDVEDSPPSTNFSPVICSYSSIYRSVMPATISGVMSGIC